MKITGDEPAYPFDLERSKQIEEGYWYNGSGLTIRQQFAMAAMQGMLANPDGCMTEGRSRSFHPTTLAECAVNQAERLIDALNK